MALHNQLTFLLLVSEVVMFIILVLPFPFTWRKAMLSAIARSTLARQIQYWSKISFIGVGLLFVDATQSMIKMQREGALAKEIGTQPDLRGATDMRSRKFLAERNWYLTGFTLFLSLILSRTYSLILELIQAQEELAILKAQPQGVDPLAQGKLEALQKDYDDLSKQHISVAAVASDKRVD